MASGAENWIAERPMFQSALFRSASLRHSLNCAIGRSGIFFKQFLMIWLAKSRSVAFRYKRHSGLAHICITVIPERPILKKYTCSLNILMWRSGIHIIADWHTKMLKSKQVYFSHFADFSIWILVDFPRPLNTYAVVGIHFRNNFFFLRRPLW